MLLKEPGCGEGCDDCSLRCAIVAGVIVSLRREHERLLREFSASRREALLSQMRQAETHLENAEQEFERVRPRQGSARPTQAAPGTYRSALLH